MGLLQRLRRIIGANINAALERAENPERMLDQLIREMEETVRETQDKAAKAIAALERLRSKLEEQQELAAKWEGRAEDALRTGDEDAAREALRRKRSRDEAAAELQEQVERQQEAVDALKESLKALRAKLEDARTRRDVLKSQAASAEAQKAAAEATGATPDTSAFDEFERMAERIEQRSDELEAAAQLDVDAVASKFEEKEQDEAIEADLQRLREKMQGGES
ncbi:MAG: PspA/IM30 family protein [Armatimonadetes bacterium]|nr:PspA/IM30 family protein [Armatimonadota bacterium]